MRTLHLRWKALKRRYKLLTITAAILIGAGVFVYAWLFADLPSIDRVQAGLTLPSTRIYDRHGRLLYEILADSSTGGRNTAIALDAIPQHCQNAAISIEDANFYAHPGVDLVGVARAAWINLRGGEVIAGGSTITQQVARNLLLDPSQRAERTVERKLREMILAVRLQNAYSKADVLALYLNQSYFGNLAYGIDAAARAYFGKSAGDLSLAECALLAGLLQAPAAYDPLTNLSAARDRQSIVLDLMARDGHISAEQAAAARTEELQFAASPFPIEAPHFVMAVITQLERTYGAALYRDGLDVITTVDLDWQRAAQRVVNYHLDGLNNPIDAGSVPAEANNGALVAIDPYTGQVLTMLGSPNYFDESIDGAVNAALALRQPGSALKPFTYAAALNPTLDDPMTAASMILDVRTPFVTRRLESYTPLNFGLVENGPVLVREALASSFNIPAVVALDHVGIEGMVSLSANAGLQSLAENSSVDLAITLGGGEVRLLDLTQAYSIFPNGGYRVDPAFILSVTTRAGESLYEWTPPRAETRTQVLDPRISFIISDILSDNSARIRAFGANSALNIGRPAAAKTGTTTDYRDNWIVGYTPNLVVGVWVGNADNTPMVDVTGVSGAAPIWNAFMREALRGQPVIDFAPPDGLIRREVCALSGLLATPDCPRRRMEWFIPDTEPIEFDTFYQRFAIDTRTGLLADESTPPNFQAQRVYVVLPQEARAWGIHAGLLPPPADADTVMPDQDVGLRLLEPDPYTTYQISPILPRATQRIRLIAGAPPNTQSVRYFMNDALIGEADSAPYSVWWTLEPGAHEVYAEATYADGTTEITPVRPFRVTVYAPPQSFTAGDPAGN